MTTRSRDLARKLARDEHTIEVDWITEKNALALLEKKLKSLPGSKMECGARYPIGGMK
jgi:hypothetical protein